MAAGDDRSQAAVLDIRGLNVWFDARDGGEPIHAVKDLDLAVAPGERVGLVGESGSGKTTTILAALGLLPASATVSGEVLVDGANVIAHGENGIAPHRWTDIAMVFQGAMSAFNPVRTVGSQIVEAVELHDLAHGRAARERAAELLTSVGLDPVVAQRFPHQFSGGMKQRALIAMALSCEPKVLLADEPTTALDVVVQDQILELLVRLSAERDLALVLVTHDLGVVARSCQRAAVMRDGEIVEQGSVDDLYHQPAHPYTRELFEATPSLAQVRAVDPQPSPAQPLLAVEGLRVDFGDLLRLRTQGPVAVDDVSFEIAEGEFVALVGQSGCGKTTTVQSILGMQAMSSGDIRLDGTSIRGLSRRHLKAMRREMQMVYQDPYEALDSRFTVRQTVEEPLAVHRQSGGAADRRERVLGALRDVGLDPARFADRYPHELSGGQRQRVAIAAALVLRPRLLLADEPVSMLDVSVRTGILQLLDRLRREHRMAVLMITHDLSTAVQYADRIIVMRDGRLEEQGTPAEVVLSPRSDYTRQLLAAVPDPDPRARTSHGPASDGPTNR